MTFDLIRCFHEKEASFVCEHLDKCDSPEPEDDAVPSATEVPDALFYAVPADGTEPLNSKDLGVQCSKDVRTWDFPSQMFTLWKLIEQRLVPQSGP